MRSEDYPHLRYKDKCLVVKVVIVGSPLISMTSLALNRKTLPHPRPREHCGTEGRKITTARREFSVRFCLLVLPQAVPIKSHEHELNKNNTNRHAKVHKESPRGLNLTQGTTGNE